MTRVNQHGETVEDFYCLRCKTFYTAPRAHDLEGCVIALSDRLGALEGQVQMLEDRES